jgi:hypothetical protein
MKELTYVVEVRVKKVSSDNSLCSKIRDGKRQVLLGLFFEFACTEKALRF